MKDGRYVILIVIVISLTNAEYEDLCLRFQDGIKFREPGNCQAYVTCKNGVGTVTTCPSGQLYNKEKKACEANLNDDYCNELCASKNNVWVKHQISCQGFYYCSSGQALYGECNEGFHFNQTEQLCIFEYDSICNDVSDFCGIVPKSTKFSNTKNCKLYYECTDSGSYPLMRACKDGQYYNPVTAACKSMDEVPCSAHPVPTGICGTDSKPLSGVFKSDGATCRGYFYCAYMGKGLSDKNPGWSKCAEGLFFDEKTEACVYPPLVRCTHNRCEGRGNATVVADTWGCRYYQQCQDGVPTTSAPIRCPWDMFFSEKLQACIYDEVSDPACDYDQKKSLP